MLGHYFEDMNKEGLLSEFRYLDNSSDFFWVPPGYSTSISYDSVAVILKATAPSLWSIDYKWETLRIIPLSAGMATFTGIIQGVITDTTGTVTKLRLIETGTVIRRKSGWKLLNGQMAILPE